MLHLMFIFATFTMDNLNKGVPYIYLEVINFSLILKGNQVNLMGCLFVQNFASDSGGAIYATSFTNLTVNETSLF